jgi:extracellular elastinolytic metalloproteinase
VWCTALWEVFVNLVAKYQDEEDDDDDDEEGHEKAERRMLTYVINGLKNTPLSPTFTEARDGIITAVTALHPEDLPEVWAGFAKRGMGVGAVSPSKASVTFTGVVQSFAVP